MLDREKKAILCYVFLFFLYYTYGGEIITLLPFSIEMLQYDWL